jgi:hypothetical protein
VEKCLRMREHYKDTERCTKCGGKCCRIYLSCHEGGARPINTWFEEWVEQWDQEFEDCGITAEYEPLFDPLVVHHGGNEHMIDELICKGIDPWGCKYLLKDGCMIPWEKRPNTCKEYRCYDWRHEDEDEKE